MENREKVKIFFDKLVGLIEPFSYPNYPVHHV